MIQRAVNDSDCYEWSSGGGKEASVDLDEMFRAGKAIPPPLGSQECREGQEQALASQYEEAARVWG